MSHHRVTVPETERYLGSTVVVLRAPKIIRFVRGHADAHAGR
jgi:hypothetical protein